MPEAALTDDPVAARSISTWKQVAIPAIAMCLGWGLRGQFGGPRGAMVPGALVALALVLVSRKQFTPTQVWLIAAAGALGFGIGGEETYAQTVGISRNNDLNAPFWNGLVLWGYLGLLIKGALWGGFGGLFIGAAMGGKQYRPSQLLLAFNLAFAAAFVAFWIVNEPKLIYFSGHGQGKPRPEAWAGLVAAWLTLHFLASRAGDRAATRLSTFGAIGCGLGFSLARLAYSIGERWLAESTGPYVDWWKVMECGFGLIGGIFLGLGALRVHEGGRPAERPPAEEFIPTANVTTPPGAITRATYAWLYPILALDLLALFWVADSVDGIGGLIGKTPFLFLSPALMLLAMRSNPLALVLGIVMPIALTFWNVQHYWLEEHHVVGYTVSIAGLLILTALVAEMARRFAEYAVTLFNLVMWTCVACAWVKMLFPVPSNWQQPLVTQSLFTVMALWLSITIARKPARNLEPISAVHP